MFRSDTFKWWLIAQHAKILAFYSELWFVSVVYTRTLEDYQLLAVTSMIRPLNIIHAHHTKIAHNVSVI